MRTRGNVVSIRGIVVADMGYITALVAAASLLVLLLVFMFSGTWLTQGGERWVGRLVGKSRVS